MTGWIKGHLEDKGSPGGQYGGRIPPGAAMELTTWQQYADQLHRILSSLACTDRCRKAIATDGALDLWRQWTLDLRGRCGTVYLIGNGASASMASHLSADLAKNAGLHTQVFSDLSLITAISNDMGYEHVFAEPLRRRGRPIDMLVAISSSGRSPNVLAATEVARDLEMTIVTLSSMSPDNPLRSRGQLNLHVAASTYGMAENCHAAVLHRWADLVRLENVNTHG